MGIVNNMTVLIFFLFVLFAGALFLLGYNLQIIVERLDDLEDQNRKLSNMISDGTILTKGGETT